MESITESDCPQGYLYAKYEDHVIFHKIVLNELHVPKVTACIRVDDEWHVKLFLRDSPVPLPQCFRYGHNCKLTSKSMLENFSSYLESQTENFSIFYELRKRQFKKNQVCYSEIIQYALLLHYTSLQSYKLLLDEFPLPSISLLNKIKEGNIDAQARNQREGAGGVSPALFQKLEKSALVCGKKCPNCGHLLWSSVVIFI